MVDKNFQSKTGESFSSDGFAVIFREGQLVIDFKNTAPRLDDIGGDKRQTIVSEHQPVILDPQRAKALKQVLEQNISRYEDKYGEIELENQEPSEDIDVDESRDYIA